MRRLAPLALIVVLLPIAAGCSDSKPYGGSRTTATPEHVSGTPKPKPQGGGTVPAQYKNGDAVAGKADFKAGPCGGCHTLVDAGTHGTVGPNLTDAKPPLSLVITRLLNGGPGGMPSFKGQYSTKKIADIAAYVVKSTGGNPNG